MYYIKTYFKNDKIFIDKNKMNSNKKKEFPKWLFITIYFR